ncbi:MAG: HEAT repeat domain-containing protein [Anaerolineales bacterium]|nr:HEAT repeat domain-containing protein [Anaerolineales bacterium]
MTKIDDYRQTLKKLDDWIPFLLKESCLPGPRGNLELAHAVAQEGKKQKFEQFLSFQAEENTPEVFLVFCGVLGLGKLAANEPGLFDCLRPYASDTRWRVREAVATGLQLAGDQDMDVLLKEMKKWGKGNWYERRAVAAGLAEPRLLKNPKHVKQVLQVLNEITAAMESAQDTKHESFRVLRQGMSFCWSVVVSAFPEMGKPIFEKWLNSPNKDIRWMMKENLKKNRLIKMDPGWVKACNRKLD